MYWYTGSSWCGYSINILLTICLALTCISSFVTANWHLILFHFIWEISRRDAYTDLAKYPVINAKMPTGCANIDIKQLLKYYASIIRGKKAINCLLRRRWRKCVPVPPTYFMTEIWRSHLLLQDKFKVLFENRNITVGLELWIKRICCFKKPHFNNFLDDVSQHFYYKFHAQ